MKYFSFNCFGFRCLLHNAKSFTQFYFHRIFNGKSFNLKMWFIEDCLLHFINLQYANPEVLTSVLQEKREVYFICCCAKLLFFTCRFIESNTAIHAIKYPCVIRKQICGKQLCFEVLKTRLIWLWLHWSSSYRYG